MVFSEVVEVVFSEATSLFDYSAMQAMNKISAEYKSKGKQLLGLVPTQTPKTAQGARDGP